MDFSGHAVGEVGQKVEEYVAGVRPRNSRRSAPIVGEKHTALACVLSAGLFCPIFGFMQGKGTIAAAIIMIVAAVIGGVSWLYSYNMGLLSG